MITGSTTTVEAAISNYNQQIAQTEKESGELARQAYCVRGSKITRIK